MILTPKQKEKVQNGNYGFGSKKDPRELWPRAEVPYDMSYDLGKKYFSSNHYMKAEYIWPCVFVNFFEQIL